MAAQSRKELEEWHLSQSTSDCKSYKLDEPGAVNNAQLTAPHITLTSTANDSYGTISRVDIRRSIIFTEMGGSRVVPQSFNRYTYAANDPVNLVDPAGLMETWWDFGWGGTDASKGHSGFGGWGWGDLNGTGWGDDPRPGQTIINEAMARQAAWVRDILAEKARLSG